MAFVGVVAGTHEKVTVGDSRSTVMLAGEPAVVVVVLPARSETLKVPPAVSEVDPDEPAPTVLVTGIVQTFVPLPVMVPIVPLPTVKSSPLVAEIVVQSSDSPACAVS